MRMLDLFCGRWGWSKAFAAHGWECVGVDLVEPPEIPEGCDFVQANILDLKWTDLEQGFYVTAPSGNDVWLGVFDFICASSPCEQFSVHGMKHFHPNPKYPEMGIKLFNHTRSLCEASGVLYVMENVRAAQEFVGKSINHAGPFHLWGTGVPLLMPQGIKKGMSRGNSKVVKMLSGVELNEYRKANSGPGRDGYSSSKARIEETAKAATIPPELSACVADYAERLIEMRTKP